MSSDPMAKRETLELVRAYYKHYRRAKVRKRIFELTKALAAAVAGNEEGPVTGKRVTELRLPVPAAGILPPSRLNLLGIANWRRAE